MKQCLSSTTAPVKSTACGKIGVVTYYRYNYGSVLQCYATCEVARKKGYQALVLDKKSNKTEYLMSMLLRCLSHPRYIREFYGLWQAQRTCSLNSLSHNALSMMDAFIAEHLPVRVVSSFEMIRMGKDSNYRAFLSGSDQIWNGHRFIVPQFHFLRFAPSHKRIAWAPSIGTSEIAVYNMRMYKKFISEYASLSVRETQGVQIIQELTGQTPVQLIDPVFLLSKEEWSSLVTKNTNEKYVLCYFLDQPDVDTVEKIAEYCRYASARLIVFGCMTGAYAGLKDCISVDGGPAEFVSMICNARCLFTDSFHGTSFAIIQHTPFFAFRRNYKHGIDQSSRLQSILRMCRMEEAFEPQELKAMDYPFDYADTVIANKRAEMLDYLQKSIDKAQRRDEE